MWLFTANAGRSVHLYLVDAKKRHRGDNGKFAMRDDAPRFMTDGLRQMNPAELRRRAAVVAQQARRAGDATPAKGLSALPSLRYHVERLEHYAVANARGLGWTWENIAESLGISKQVLHRRYGKQFAKLRRKRAYRRDVAGG